MELVIVMIPELCVRTQYPFPGSIKSEFEYPLVENPKMVPAIMIPSLSIISLTLTGTEIPEIRFHPSSKPMVVSFNGFPVNVVLPSL